MAQRAIVERRESAADDADVRVVVVVDEMSWMWLGLLSAAARVSCAYRPPTGSTHLLTVRTRTVCTVLSRDY
jgi:hypothetical protein